ncbi:MAG: acetone carboxylase subunit gamma [Salinisphaera sp.]|nr:acetone carboxylase subunit gamma [Salinisphaera sp.]
MTRRVCMTEYLAVDLDEEQWVCRRCDHRIMGARENYKKGLLLHSRPPGEIHRPLIDADKYEFTFEPDPRWCQIVECYCPECGTMIEVEYLIPGHAPSHDIEVDLDALKKQVEDYPGMLEEPSVGPDVAFATDHGHHHHNQGE